MLVEEPKESDRGTTNYEEEELHVPVLIVGELMNEYLRASDVNESASSETQHN